MGTQGGSLTGRLGMTGPLHETEQSLVSSFLQKLKANLQAVTLPVKETHGPSLTWEMVPLLPGDIPSPWLDVYPPARGSVLPALASAF